MGITKDIKETARKVTHQVVDKTQEIAGITKSPSELAKRLVDYLTHREYKEAALMLTVEMKKYLDKMDLSENSFALQKFEVFEKATNNLAGNLDNSNYEKALSELEKIIQTIPEEVTKDYKEFKVTKNVLQNIIDTLKKSIQKNTEPEFNDLMTVFENSFTQFEEKNK